MDDELKKKNVLDLQFQKYLSIASTSIIVAFTYLIGVGVAIVTKQIRLDDFFIIGILGIISVGVLGFCSIIFFNAISHLKKIPKVLKNI